MIKSVATVNGVFYVGKEYQLNEEQADDYLRLGWAVRIREAAAHKPTNETAAMRGASKR